MTWDCKYKIGKDNCQRRKTGCFPGGKYCVLKGNFEFPLREEVDELDNPGIKARQRSGGGEDTGAYSKGHSRKRGY